MTKNYESNRRKVLSKLQVKSQIVKEMFAEFLGIFVLLTFGNGSVAQSVLSGGRNGGFLSINWAYGMGVTMAIYIAGNVSGAHVNPAMSIMLSIWGKLPLWKLPFYILAQFLGSIFSSAIVYWVYLDALNQFDGGVRMVTGPVKTAGIFATYPAEHLSIGNGFLDQVVGTALLAGIILAITDQKNNKITDGLTPVLIGLLVFSIGLSYGFNCGYAINPARDFGPRLFTFMVGYGSQVFTEGNYWFWVPIIAPVIGAVVGSLFYNVLIGLQYNQDPNEVHVIEDFQTSNEKLVQVTTSI